MRSLIETDYFDAFLFSKEVDHSFKQITLVFFPLQFLEATDGVKMVLLCVQAPTAMIHIALHALDASSVCLIHMGALVLQGSKE